MRTQIAASLVAGLLLLGSATQARGEGEESAPAPVQQRFGWFLPGFGFDGSNTLRYDHFGTKGPSPPYPFDGAQIADEFDVNMRNDDGDYRHWRGEFSGVLLNKAGYRAPDKGIVPERINLTREAGDRRLGDRTVPYRWEVGDYFSYLSFVTQQQSMKGLQVEAQPRLGGRPDSLIWFLGTNESRWQEVFQTSAFPDDLSTGASYLLESERLGAIAVDGIFNHRADDAALGLAQRDQFVASAAVDKPFDLYGQALNLEVATEGAKR